jgi:hypothetical protein
MNRLQELAGIKEGAPINFESGKKYKINLPKSKICDIMNNFVGEMGPIKINNDYSINVHKISRLSDFSKVAGTFVIECSVSAFNHQFGHVEDPKTKKITSPISGIIFEVTLK